MRLDLKVASVGGSFEGEIALSDKVAPQTCRITVSGSGTLGHGTGEARFTLEPADGGTLLAYEGAGEIGGLVAGVGQRVLRGVSNTLSANSSNRRARNWSAQLPSAKKN